MPWAATQVSQLPSPGALAFLKQQQDVHLIMVGDESAVRQALSAANAPMERITVLHASEVVGMDEAPSACPEK